MLKQMEIYEVNVELCGPNERVHERSSFQRFRIGLIQFQLFSFLKYVPSGSYVRAAISSPQNVIHSFQ